MTIPDEAVQADKTLWCVNIKGPDDIISVPDHLSAVRVANTFNAWWLDLITKKPLTDNHPRMWAEPIEWPYSEGHGEDVTDPNNEYQWLRELAAQAPSPRAQALEEAEAAIDELRLQAFRTNSDADRQAYFDAVSKWFQDRHYRRMDAERALSSQPVADGCKTEREQALEKALKPFSDIAGELFAMNYNESDVVFTVHRKTPKGSKISTSMTFKAFNNARAALPASPGASE